MFGWLKKDKPKKLPPGIKEMQESTRQMNETADRLLRKFDRREEVRRIESDRRSKPQQLAHS